MTDEIFRGDSADGGRLVIAYSSLTELYTVFLRDANGYRELDFEPGTIGEMVDALDRHIIKEAMRRTREGTE